MSERLNVVFDTQIFLRALINRKSVCARISDVPLRGHYTLFISDAIEAEIEDVFSRPKVRTKFSWITDEFIAETWHSLRDEAQRVEVEVVEPVSRDHKDDIFLACAKAAKADYLISEDNDLLVLEHYGSTSIINAFEFLAILENR